MISRIPFLLAEYHAPYVRWSILIIDGWEQNAARIFRSNSLHVVGDEHISSE